MATIQFTGPEQVSRYAFVMLRSAVIFRIKHGQSLLRGQEARMARNHGWSTRARFSPALLDDLHIVGDRMGIPRPE